MQKFDVFKKIRINLHLDCKYAAHNRCKQVLQDSHEPCHLRQKVSLNLLLQQINVQTDSRGSIQVDSNSTTPSDSPSNSRRNTLRRQKRHPLDENTLRIVLVSESEEVAVALADEFTNEYFPEVTVVKGNYRN